MKKFKAVLAFWGVVVGVMVGLAACFSHPGDDYVMSKVVRILNEEKGMCSGEQVKAPSGANYVLTAAHCRPLADAVGSYRVKTETGAIYYLRSIAEDDNADLLLLEGVPGMEGLEVAKGSLRGEYVETFTHGQNLDTYKTTGVLIQERIVPVPMFPLEDEYDKVKMCESKPKYRALNTPFGDICVLYVPMMVSTAFTTPGSSGGPIVNASGQLVGVVSAGGNGFSLFVRTIDIRDFLGEF